MKILSFWGDRKLYDKDTMQQLEAALLSGDPNATLQPPGPKPVSQCILLLLTHFCILSSSLYVSSMVIESNVSGLVSPVKFCQMCMQSVSGLNSHEDRHKNVR